MINIYVQGSKLLGLGHLSRIVPIYKGLESCYNNVNLYFHGDEVGESYLKVNSVDFFSLTKKVIKIKDSELWIIDSTDVYEQEIEKSISRANTVVLLSPKFNSNKFLLFTHAILRSDPFSIPVKSKFISKDYFSYNRGVFENYIKKNTIGVALSGSDSSNSIQMIVNAVINNDKLSDHISGLKVFLGSTYSINFSRISKESRLIDIEFISSLRSIWNFKTEIDLLIVGNGIILDECILENQNFILFNNIKSNSVIKSFDVDYVKQFEATDIKSLIKKMQAFFLKDDVLKSTRVEPFLSKNNNPTVNKIIDLLTLDI